MIKVNLSSTSGITQTEPITQWDFGRCMEITGLDIQKDIEVHFANHGEDTAIIMMGKYEDQKWTVEIPDISLTKGTDVFVFVYESSATSGRTTRKARIPITKRAKPVEYVAPETKDYLMYLLEEAERTITESQKIATSATIDRQRLETALIRSTSSGTTFHETDCAAVPPVNIELFGKCKQGSGSATNLIKNPENFTEGWADSTGGTWGDVELDTAGTYTLEFAFKDSECTYWQLLFMDEYGGEIKERIEAFSPKLTFELTQEEVDEIKIISILVNMEDEGKEFEYVTLKYGGGGSIEPIICAGENGEVNQALLGANLCNIYDKSPLYDSHMTIDSDGWCCIKYDNSESIDPVFVATQINPSKYLKPSTEYLVIIETKDMDNGWFYPVTTEHDMLEMLGISMTGQFITEIPTITNEGIKTFKIRTRNDFTECTDMLYFVSEVCTEIYSRFKYRISIIEDLSVTEDTFVYEPYTEQPFTALTPNGLGGIPLGQTIPDVIKVSSIHMSGVYWDEKEEAYYISDTKNYNGKNVKRIGLIESYDNEEITITPYMSNTGRLSEGATVYYILPEPIVTDLTEEEIEQYDALCMNYPTTTIANDAGAHMKVTHVKDTQKHIEQNYIAKTEHDALVNRVSEIEQAIANL